MRFAIIFLVLVTLSIAGCATSEPVARELPGLPGPVNPDKNIILRIALEFLRLSLVADQYDPESAKVVFRDWEAHYVEVRLYHWIVLEKRTAFIRVFVMDGYAEWSSQAAVDKLKTGER